MKRLWILFLLSTLLISKALCEKKYASPSGNQINTGETESSTWSLSYALSGSAPLLPGDSLILLDGVYEGNYVSNINGTIEKPIYILPKNENKAIIDVSKNRTTGTGLTVNGTYTWIIGIHVTSSSLIRRSEASNGFSPVPYESGIAVFGDNNKVINCWIYDVVGGGLELWRTGRNVEVYGSVIFNNGSQDQSRGTGHGMYIQHDEPNQPKLIENNVVFQNASQGINIFTTNPENKGIKVFRNVSFNTGIIATFDPFLFRPPHNLTIGSQNNLSSEMEVAFNLFYSDLQGQRLSTNDVSNVTIGRTFSPNRNISFYNNILFGGRNVVEFQPLEGLIFKENKLINAHGNFFAFLGNVSSFPNALWDLNGYSNLANFPKPFQGFNFQEWKTGFAPFDSNSQYSISPPSSLREVLITQNKYDSARFFVSVLNFTDAEAVFLDFSNYPELKGSEYVISDLQNPFDPEQKASGSFQGNTIMFPMNWTKSLQPKGNMPFTVVHTDLTFGAFLLVFEKKKEEVVNFPEVRDSLALFITTAGTALLAPQDFLAEQPSEPFTYSSSTGFEFDCFKLGSNDVSITLKNTRTGKEQIKPIVVWVFDTIPPDFEATNANLPFDKTIGKVLIDPGSFFIREEFIFENCLVPGGITIDISVKEITCADLDPDGSYLDKPVTITMTDKSGNSTSKVRKINLNVFESKKVSITASEILQGQPVTVTLGDELGYSVKYWKRFYQGQTELFPEQKGKTFIATLSGTYSAVLNLQSGCEVSSKEIVVEVLAAEWPTPKSEVSIPLDEEGKAILEPKDFFDTWPLENEGLTFQLSKTNFTCTDLGINEVKLTLRNLVGETEEFPVKVVVEDRLPPDFEATDANLPFDLTIGKVALDYGSFFIRTESISENCLNSLGVKIELSKTEITCADFNPDGTYDPVSVTITVTDQSGNATSKIRKVNLNLFESKKISISPESGAQYTEGKIAEIRLGEEFEFAILGWYRNGQLIEGEKGKAILTEMSGTYYAKLIPAGGGCAVESNKTEIKFNPLPFGQIKEIVTLILGPSGKADLSPSDVFVSWPTADPTLEITLSQSAFTCENIGEKEVTIAIKSKTGESWERKTKVLIKDQTSPVLVPKNISIDLDVTKGAVEITPEMILAEFGDNCGIKSLTINKNRFTCDDIGKEISVGIRAEDNVGNIKEAVSIVTVKRVEKDLVGLSGTSTFCKGESSVIGLGSTVSFEVIRWRRNGTEIPGQTGKTLTVTEPGIYHAVIRYEGGCLAESKELEVKVNPLPEGKIDVDGNILRAPQGDFAYQWFRNGEKLENETSRTFTAQLMGDYYVEMTSAAGCKAKLDAVTLTISGIFSRPVEAAKELKIYPNPASDRVTIEFPDGVLASKPSLLLYSSDGKSVTSAVQISILNDTEVEILLNRLSKGTYFIRAVGQNQETYFGKLVILY